MKGRTMNRQVLMLVIASVAAVACDRPSMQRPDVLSPDTAGGPPMLLVQGAAAPAEASRPPGFHLLPAPYREGQVSLAVGGHLSINAASMRGIVASGSRLRVDWGDGSRGGADCGSCRVDHVYHTAGLYMLAATLGEPADGNAAARTERWAVNVEAEPRLSIRIRDVVIDPTPPPPNEDLIAVHFRIESSSSYPVTWLATLFDGPNAVGSGVPPDGGLAVFWVGRFQVDPIRVTLTAFDEHGLEAEPVVIWIPTR